MVQIGIRIAFFCVIGTFGGIFGICGPINNGVADFIAQPGYRLLGLEHYARQKRSPYFAEKVKWDKQELTWHFYPRSLPNNVTDDSVRSIIRTALQIWSKASGLNFCEVSSNADIQIRFERSFHKIRSIKCASFKADEVAHAFAPYESSIFKGHLHLNSEMTFSTNGEPGTYDLFQVILHELGHVIGLVDSKSDVNPKPVMADAYQPGVFNITLQKEDIDKVKELYKELQHDYFYGKHFRYFDDPKKPFTPSFCNRLEPIDAAFEAPNSTAYILHGQTYTQFFHRTPISQGLIHDKWKEVDIPVDAAYADLGKNQIVFLKSPNYWRYTNGILDDGFPKLFVIGDHGDSKIDAAVKWTGADDRIYLFKGDAVHRYNDTNNNMQEKVTVPIVETFGQINATLRMGDVLYLFQGKKITAVQDSNFLPIWDYKGIEFPMDLPMFFHCRPTTWIDAKYCS